MADMCKFRLRSVVKRILHRSQQYLYFVQVLGEFDTFVIGVFGLMEGLDKFVTGSSVCGGGVDPR